MITIKNIDCYGAMSEYATVNMEGEWADGEELSQLYLGSHGFTTWTQLVNYAIKAGQEEGYTISEISSFSLKSTPGTRILSITDIEGITPILDKPIWKGLFSCHISKSRVFSYF